MLWFFSHLVCLVQGEPDLSRGLRECSHWSTSWCLNHPLFSTEIRRLCRSNINCAPAVLSAAVDGGDRPYAFKCRRNVFSSSTFPTLMGRFEHNRLVHMYFGQWELSLEGLSKAHSGLGRTVGCITRWSTTGTGSLFLPGLFHATLSLQRVVIFPCVTISFHYMPSCVSICCMFRHVRLGAPRPFHALLYEWG